MGLFGNRKKKDERQQTLAELQELAWKQGKLIGDMLNMIAKLQETQLATFNFLSADFSPNGSLFTFLYRTNDDFQTEEVCILEELFNIKSDLQYPVKMSLVGDSLLQVVLQLP